MKKDPDYGADDLETFGMMCEAFGTALYCILGGWIIFWNEEAPQTFFWLIVATGGVTFISGLVYPQSSDEVDEHFDSMSTGKRIREKLDLFWQAVTLPEVRNLLIFFGIVALLSPNLEEFLIYFNEMMMVTPLFEGYAEVVLFVAGALIFTLYNNYVMSKSEVHIPAVIAILFRVISALFFAADANGLYPAGKTLMIQAVAIRSFVDAFLFLPGMIMFTKMVPHNIEGMMIGFAWGLIKFNADVLGRLITVGLNLKFKVEGEPTGEALIALEEAIEAGEEEVNPFMNLYKMYLI